MLNLASRPTASLMSWTSPRFDGSKGYPPKGYYYNCNKSEPYYVKAGAWSPDDKTVYLASTGYRPWNANSIPLRGLCDSASAFAATGSRPAMKWTNYTGCDSLFAVAADANAAYFAGHERFSQNTNGLPTSRGWRSGTRYGDREPLDRPSLLNSRGTAGCIPRAREGADDMLVPVRACGSQRQLRQHLDVRRSTGPGHLLPALPVGKSRLVC